MQVWEWISRTKLDFDFKTQRLFRLNNNLNNGYESTFLNSSYIFMIIGIFNLLSIDKN